MKNLKLLGLLLAFAAVFTSVQSEAISLRLKSKIFSSGVDIYPCNAGVASAFPPNQVCYFHGRPELGACTPGSCDSAKENCNTNCICSTTPGSSLLNSIKMDTQDYVDRFAPATVAHPLDYLSAYGQAFVSYFGEAQAWTQRFTNLRTHFKSELYTGAYFLDVCYLGSKLADGLGYYAISTQASAIPFIVKDERGFLAFDNNRDGLDFSLAGLLGAEYTEKAGLTVQRFVVCSKDKQSNAEFIIDPATGLPAGGKGSFYSATGEASLRASAQTVSHGGLTDPRFCKIRYVFRETNYKGAVPTLRSNVAEGAEVCTYTVVNDPK